MLRYQVRDARALSNLVDTLALESPQQWIQEIRVSTPSGRQIIRRGGDVLTLGILADLNGDVYIYGSQTAAPYGDYYEIRCTLGMYRSIYVKFAYSYAYLEGEAE